MNTPDHDGITILGSFVVDLTSRAPHLPVKGETVVGSFFKYGPGGKGANQATAARRVGGKVSFMTKVGTDVFGTVALESFKKEGLFSDMIRIDRTAQTGTALILLDDEGSNSILVVPGACATITDEEVDLLGPALDRSAVFLSQLEINMTAIERGISLAHAKHVPVVLNTAPVIVLPDRLYALVDTVTPNEVEAEILSGIKVDSLSSCRAASRFFFDKGVRRVIITLGAAGVYAHDGMKDLIIEALPVTVVDTTGAGDAFNGGFVAALSKGMDFFEAVRYGTIVAGLSVTRFGTAPSMPYADEVDHYLS
ncbi:MAG: ribokinase [Sphaerochaetaceae bacterium]|nr:ribokinase [Sphaerochaetaceae bacterium]